MVGRHWARIGGVGLLLALTWSTTSSQSIGQRTVSRTVAAPGIVSGRAIDADTGRPIVGATISLTAMGPNAIPHVARSNAEGRFRLHGLTPGRYLLAASRSGYVRYVRGRDLGRQGQAHVDRQLIVRAGEHVVVDATLQLGGSIEGTVINRHGDAMSRITVQVLRRRVLGSTKIYTAIAYDQTDERGRFRVFDIPPGQYVLAAVPRMVFLDAGAEQVYPPTYYPGALEPNDAATVVMTPGARLEQHDFTLLDRRATTIEGRIVAEDGRPAGAATIAAVRWPAASATETVHAGPDGRFTIHGAVPGMYRLTARWTGDAGRPHSARSELTLGEQTATLTMTVRPSLEVRGRVLIEPAGTLDPRTIDIAIASEDASDLRAGPITTQATADRTFLLRGVSRQPARILVRPPGDAYVRSIRIGASEVTDDEVDFSRVAQDGLVEITLSTAGAGLTGVVRDHSGQIAPGATVLLFSANRARHRPYSRFTKIAVADERGRFSLSGVIPDEYVVTAVVEHEFGAEHDAVYLGTLERGAMKVSVQVPQQPLAAAIRVQRPADPATRYTR